MNPYIAIYNELRDHIGHQLELNDIWDWTTNRETGLEIRCKTCAEKGACEPLLELDTPKD